ncbi:hypothetical protein [Kineosporia sp. A_224]|nr:hypothetical protein [Kineosporia sp. A_224]
MPREVRFTTIVRPLRRSSRRTSSVPLVSPGASTGDAVMNAT